MDGKAGIQGSPEGDTGSGPGLACLHSPQPAVCLAEPQFPVARQTGKSIHTRPLELRLPEL